MAGDYPDVIVGCTGGGSNFAGIVFPFLGRQLRGGRKVDIVAIEPAACPSLTRGQYAYDFGDTAHLTPAHQDAHAGLDVHATGLPRRGPALPRHGTDGVAPEGARPDRRARLPPVEGVRGGRDVRARPRASCPRPKRTTRSRAQSTRRSAAARKAARRRSCSTSAATATSTCRPTSTTRRQAAGPRL